MNKIGALDPDSMEVRYYEGPDDHVHVRRPGLDSNDSARFVSSTMGKIGRLDPATGEISRLPHGT